MSITRTTARFSAVCTTTLCLAGAAAGAALVSPGTALAASPSPSSSRVSALDKELLTAAHQGNLWEIETGQAAQTDATTSCVKKVGAEFVRDHRTLDAGVTKTAAQVGVKLPSGQTADQRKQAAALKAMAKKPSYDGAWLKAQYAAHTQTLALIDKVIASGTNAKVRELAKTARPVVAQHTQMVSHDRCRPPQAHSSQAHGSQTHSSQTPGSHR
ncbi:DUF4142 domain-containing protein [Streptomyces celluloflavus]|uniref:DUF4142 domain-containing protein n=1 Tax=Streptomyces celluloflavus TaxID=58344 RepID=UPI0036BA1B1D